VEGYQSQVDLKELNLINMIDSHAFSGFAGSFGCNVATDEDERGCKPVVALSGTGAQLGRIGAFAFSSNASSPQQIPFSRSHVTFTELDSLLEVGANAFAQFPGIVALEGTGSKLNMIGRSAFAAAGGYQNALLSIIDFSALTAIKVISNGAFRNYNGVLTLVGPGSQLAKIGGSAFTREEISRTGACNIIDQCKVTFDSLGRNFNTIEQMAFRGFNSQIVLECSEACTGLSKLALDSFEHSGDANSIVRLWGLGDVPDDGSDLLTHTTGNSGFAGVAKLVGSCSFCDRPSTTTTTFTTITSMSTSSTDTSATATTTTAGTETVATSTATATITATAAVTLTKVRAGMRSTWSNGSVAGAVIGGLVAIAIVVILTLVGCSRARHTGQQRQREVRVSTVPTAASGSLKPPSANIDTCSANIDTCDTNGALGLNIHNVGQSYMRSSTSSSGPNGESGCGVDAVGGGDRNDIIYAVPMDGAALSKSNMYAAPTDLEATVLLDAYGYVEDTLLVNPTASPLYAVASPAPSSTTIANVTANVCVALDLDGYVEDNLVRLSSA
jgi:hypothetical protein